MCLIHSVSYAGKCEKCYCSALQIGDVILWHISERKKETGMAVQRDSGHTTHWIFPNALVSGCWEQKILGFFFVFFLNFHVKISMTPQIPWHRLGLIQLLSHSLYLATCTHKDVCTLFKNFHLKKNLSRLNNNRIKTTTSSFEHEWVTCQLIKSPFGP